MATTGQRQNGGRGGRRSCFHRFYITVVITAAVIVFFFYGELNSFNFDLVYSALDAKYNHSEDGPLFNVSISPDQINRSCGYLVRSRWDGRLGNQMFAYASFYGIVRKLKFKKEVFIHVSEIPSSLDLVFENLSLPQKMVWRSWFNENDFLQRSERRCCAYDGSGIEELACDGKNVIIAGYRQSYKYFAHVMDEVKKEFTFSAAIREHCRGLLENNLAQRGLRKDQCITVGAHLRRGDFATPGKIQFGHWPAQEDYLRKAIGFYETKFYENETREDDVTCLVFFLFGNDHQWNTNVSKSITLLKPNNTHLILIDHRKSDPAIDLCVMSICDHTIITTGTFSWWAGFLNRGIVTRQTQFARPHSNHIAEYVLEDYFLPSWIPL